MIWKQKMRQEKVLEDLILSSKLINREVLDKVRSSYLDNPYHNYLHALKVASYILYLDPKTTSITQVKSLLFAALFHDAGRSSETKRLDEFVSLDIAINSLELFLREQKIAEIDASIVRQAIMGTVFSERGKIRNKYAQILSDCDIGVIGEDLGNYCYYSIPLHLEFRQDFHTFITKSQKGYIGYLMNIDSRVIVSEEIRNILPKSHRTITDFCQLDMGSKISMHETLREEDITLAEFKEKFNLH